MKEVIKSRLLQPTRIERMLERLVELLPRNQLLSTIEPNDKIEQICNSPGDYRSKGKGALFELVLSDNPRGGWYYLEAALSRGNGDRRAGLIAKTTRGELFIQISSNLRGSIREVIYLPHGILTMHWQPCDAPGYFSQTPLLLHRITLPESVLRRIYRIVYDAYRWEGGWGAIRSLASSLINLDRIYKKNIDSRISRFGGGDYSSFLIRADRRDQKEGAIARAVLASKSSAPRFVIVVKYSGESFSLLKTTIGSIIAQDYTNFDIFIFDNYGAPSTIDGYVRFFVENLHIKILSLFCNINEYHVYNSVLFETGADLFLKLNAGDKIPSSALSVFASEFVANPEISLIYSDHDFVDENGRRFSPAFKPDWNKELFLSFNYIGPSCVFSVDEFKRVGGYDTALEYCGNYDLILRIVDDKKNGTRVRHIPSVLFHCVGHSSQEGREWPSCEMICTESNNERRSVLGRHFFGKGIKVEDGLFPGIFRVRYPLPSQLPLVSIIIPTKDRIDLLRKCIESIKNKTTYWNFEILVIDNASDELASHEYFREIQRDPRVFVLEYNNCFNYSAINNFAVSESSGDVVALVNNDVEVIDGEWLGELVSYALISDVGAVGAKLLYEDNTVQHAGVVLGIGGVAGHIHRFINDSECGYGFRAIATQDVSAVTAACLVVRKNVYIEAGGLNCVDLTVAYNDVDFCLKLKELGYRNVYAPHAKLFHHESVSRGRDDTLEKARRFESESEYMKRRWAKKLRFDPLYNRNLTQSFENVCYNQFV